MTPRLTARTFLGLCVFAAAFSAASAARAGLQVCNDTSSMIGVAVGYRLQDGWNTEGWWRIPKGVCASIVDGDLAARFFYLYAENSETGGEWRGPVFMCTSTKEFRIKDTKDCFTRGYERTGFFEVDTGEQKNWQVRLTEKNQSEKPAE